MHDAQLPLPRASDACYQILMDDLALLDETKHWLGWLGASPRDRVRREIETVLARQVPGTHVEELRIIAEPQYLTGGRRSDIDPHDVIVTRAAVAAPFVAVVRPPDQDPVEVSGTLSWIAVGLDSENRRDRVFLDLGEDAASAIDKLETRIYEM